MHTLKDLLKRLADSGVEFVVIGGFAGVLHGSSYVTRDLDICAILSPENVERLRSALADLNPRHRLTPARLSFLQIPEPDERVANLYLETDWGVVDILSTVLGIGDFDRIKAKAEPFELEGKPCRVLALEDLITAKQALGRDKDLLAAKELKVIAAARRSPEGENPGV